MKKKDTDFRLIAQLLEEPAEDTNDLAAKILEALATHTEPGIEGPG